MGRVPKRFKSRTPVTAPRCFPRKKRESAKRKQWSNKSMEEALQAVRDGMGVSKAAELHAVPKTTLKDSKWPCCSWLKVRASILLD